MKCPLWMMGSTSAKLPDREDLGDCLKEECAWWIADIQMCSVRDIALELQHAQHRLQDMAVKMPHEEQFRK